MSLVHIKNINVIHGLAASKKFDFLKFPLSFFPRLNLFMSLVHIKNINVIHGLAASKKFDFFHLFGRVLASRSQTVSNKRKNKNEKNRKK
jgi:hypothetical protein